MKEDTYHLSIFLMLFLLLPMTDSFGQAVSINSTGNAPDAQSILDVSSTTKGVLLPRMTTAERTAIATANNADHGMMVYDTDTESYWYWDGATSGSWQEIPNATSASTSLDEAYDDGGSGAGRTITADAGEVVITGTGGSVALSTDGDIKLSEDQWIGLGSTIERIEFDGSLGRIDVEGASLTMDDGTWIGVDASSPRIEFNDVSGRLNMQDADIEVDNGTWIGIGSSVERIEFDGTNGEINILGADLGVGTTAPDNQSLADFRSSSKGILFPRMTTAERDAIGQGTNTDYGLWIYNEDTDLYNFWDGNSWEEVASTASIAHNTLDESYDQGGVGAGRTITADNGAVNIAGSDGLTVNGNVGIGTLTPYTALRVDVQTNGFNVPLVVRNSGANTVGDVVGIGLVNESVDYGHFYKAAMVSERTAGFGVGKLHFLVDDVSDANSVTLSESRMTILPGGNVGIGNTAPSQKLHVTGDVRISGLSAGGNVQANSNGDLIISSDIAGGDADYIQNQYSAQQSSSEYWISGRGRMDGGLTVGAGATLDNNNTNTGSIAAGALAFGNASGEGIGSKRSAGGNQYGLDFYTSSTNRLAISNTGNVGIGTTSPSNPLHVVANSTTHFDVGRFDGSNTIGTGLMLKSTAAGGRTWDIISTANAAGEGAGKLLIKDATGGSVKMTIENGGNIGVGTSAPTGLLHLNTSLTGNAVKLVNSSLASSSLLGFEFGKGETSNNMAEFRYNHAGDGSSSNFVNLGLWGNTNTLIVTGAGNVGVGTTSPTSTLDVTGKTETDQLQVGGGTTHSMIQSGTATLGSGSNISVYTVNFPSAFSSAPKVICTVRTATGFTYNDTFAVTTKSIGTTSFQVNVYRVDGSSWGQNLLLDWIAIQ